MRRTSFLKHCATVHETHTAHFIDGDRPLYTSSNTPTTNQLQAVKAEHVGDRRMIDEIQ